MERVTNETSVEINIGDNGINTTVPFFDHLLYQMVKFANIPLEIGAAGDNKHHIIEDVGICLGQFLKDIKVQERINHAFVPMDDALVFACVDFSDRGYADINVPFGIIEDGIDFELITHFLESLAREGRFNLHVVVINGHDNHHMAEAMFKALGLVIGRVGRLEDAAVLKTVGA